MRKIWVSALVLTAAACSDDTFTPNDPDLEITALTDGHHYNNPCTQSAAACFDDAQKLIDLGEVPVFLSSMAVFTLFNPSIETLTITDVEAPADQMAGERWIVDDLDLPVNARGQWELDPRTSTTLKVRYLPTALDNQDQVVVKIHSNALSGKVLEAKVLGTGDDPIGAPDIEVSYAGVTDSYTGPAMSNCATRFDGTTPVVEYDGDRPIINVCRIPDSQALDFGNISMGSTSTKKLYIRNTATCPTNWPGAAPCESCQLVIDKDPAPERYNIGVGFKPGTNDTGFFGIDGSTATPVPINQREISSACDEDGEIKILVRFNAPQTEGPQGSVLIIESNDPDEPVLEIPVRAYARLAPVAIGKLRAFDPTNPSAPYTEADDIEPLQRVYLDGRDSYDPRDPANTGLIVDYNWTVVRHPDGINPNDFAVQGQGTSLFSFKVQLAGYYEVRLKVTNDVGVQSGETAESLVTFDVIPGDKVHIQLVWDDPTNDQDLHLTRVSNDQLCSSTNDCYFGSCTSSSSPIWAPGDIAGDGGNPSLDIDDTNGLGPENINIDDPLPNTYRVYVHYWSDHAGGGAATMNTVRIYLNGVQRAEFKRSLTEYQVWAVADITWNADGTGTVTPYPSDVAGQVGEVASNMAGCSPPAGFP